MPRPAEASGPVHRLREAAQPEEQGNGTVGAGEEGNAGRNRTSTEAEGFFEGKRIVEPAELAPAIAAQSPENRRYADDLLQIGQRFRDRPYPPIGRGDVGSHGISWRGKAIANANTLRGQELFRFAILSINEGALITAHVLTRALGETLAAIVGSRRKIEIAIESRDERLLVETLDKLTSGNVYMAGRKSHYPRPFRMTDLVSETGAYLASRIRREGAEDAFLEDYRFISETAHPSQGSFAIYQRREGDEFHFDRNNPKAPNAIGWLLSSLRMNGALILSEADMLGSLSDLTPEWPNQK